MPINKSNNSIRDLRLSTIVFIFEWMMLGGESCWACSCKEWIPLFIHWTAKTRVMESKHLPLPHAGWDKPLPATAQSPCSGFGVVSVVTVAFCDSSFLSLKTGHERVSLPKVNKQMCIKRKSYKRLSSSWCLIAPKGCTVGVKHVFPFL